MGILTDAQWAEFIQHIKNTHHWEVVFIGLPALAALIAMAVLFWLIHKDLGRIAGALK